MKKILLIAILVSFSLTLSFQSRVLHPYVPLAVDREIVNKGVRNRTETRVIYAALPQYDLLLGVEGNNDLLNDHLLQNYNKSFSPATTLTYILEKPAAVAISFINALEQMIIMRALKIKPERRNSFCGMPKNCPQECTITEYIQTIKSEEAK